MAGTYPGGFVTKSPTATVGPGGDYSDGGSASGMWTLDQALALKSAGKWPTKLKNKYLWTWGRNTFGQLGDNTIIDRSSPVQIGALTTWSQIVAGRSSCFSIKTDGTMWSWGTNDYGALGDNTVLTRSSPVQVGALTTWSKISIFNGGDSVTAIKTDGTLWTWGYNFYGQLGDNTIVDKSSPIQLGALTTWSQSASGAYHTLAIKTDGTLWSWGSNEVGQLGSNTVVYRSSPVQVGALTTWSKIASGRKYTIAIKTDGTLWSFGYGTIGNLGDGTAITRSSPVQVGSLTTWSQISAGQNHTIATKTDGTIWTWGYNNRGQLGDNTVVNKSSPIQLGALTTWSQISVGQTNHSTALKTDGTIWTWGFNQYGPLGDGTVVYRSSPVQVGSLTTWAKIAAGDNYSMAISAS